MDWQDLYIVTNLEQYDYAPMAEPWTTFFTWGQLLYDQTVLEWCVYLWSLQSLSYTHVPSFATYAYTFLRFRVHVKS